MQSKLVCFAECKKRRVKPNVWFDCATINNDTALLTAKIYVNGKFAAMNHGNHYVDVSYSE